MKKLIYTTIAFILLWSCQEKDRKEKKEYSKNESYEFEGKQYKVIGADYYADGSDKFLVLVFDSLGQKYERHIGFYEDGKKKKVRLVNPQIDTTNVPKNYKVNKYNVFIYTFMGYMLEETTFYPNGRLRSIIIRNPNIQDSTFSFKAFEENGVISYKTIEKKKSAIWVSEEEKDGKITIDTSYFWR